MLVDTTYRSTDPEIMDDLEMSGDTLISTLDIIGRINRWLGGNALIISALKKVLVNHPKTERLRIIDLGCGNGEQLREIAKYGRKHNFIFDLIGVDANKATINYAIHLSEGYPEISYSQEDVLSSEFAQRKYDIALFTLFLHHFTDEEALELVQSTLAKSSKAIIVNDLHRHPVAYYLFKLITLVINNKMVVADGLTSILRGFKRADLERFAAKINHTSSINWKWAFRYEWIILRNER